MKTICVIFGGKSSEHSVSCKSAATVIRNVDVKKYKVIVVGIAKNGDWFLYEGDPESLIVGEWDTAVGMPPAALVTHSSFRGLTVFREDGPQSVEVDVVIPVLHGKFGEDGTLQGLLELAGIPYVGCGVLSSAACMDKSFTKLVVDTLGIRQAECVLVRQGIGDAVEDRCAEAETRFGYPLFVKPCSAGSSYGVSKVNNRAELLRAIESAFEHDVKVLIEQAITGRELHCAVLETEKVIASDIGEAIINSEFYTFDAKYLDETTQKGFASGLPEGTQESIKADSVRIFEALDCAGLARVDIFLEDGTNELVFNEINTFPAFSATGFYSILMEKAGYPLPVLVDQLIVAALKRNLS